jgi:serine/threonine protein phosphatase PrpC
MEKLADEPLVGEEEEKQTPIVSKVSRRLSGISSVRRPSAAMVGPIAQSLRRATSWVLGRRDSNVPIDVPSKRISDGSLPPVENTSPARKLMSVRCGGASLRGYRHQINEDALCIEANVVEGVQETGNESVGFAAVFDGHAGSGCSAHLQTALSSFVKAMLSPNGAVAAKKMEDEEWRRMSRSVLMEAFTTVDAEFLRLAMLRGDPSGSCAVACLVKGSSVVIAHVGDCAVILIERTPKAQATRLTRDHDARNSGEVNRVTSTGGVIINDRLGGRLQPFRAFGDVEFKNKNGGLTVVPDTFEQIMSPTTCLLLCSDGVTSYLTDQEIAEFVTNALLENEDDPARVASALVLHTSKAKHGLDDASAVLLVFDEVA